MGKSLFDLSPCPFCGEKAEIRPSARHKGYIAVCTGCGTMVTDRESEKPKYSKNMYDAVVEWNRNVANLENCRKSDPKERA